MTQSGFRAWPDQLQGSDSLYYTMKPLGDVPIRPFLSTAVTLLTRALKTSFLNCSNFQVGHFPSSLQHHHFSYMATWIFLQLSSRYDSPLCSKSLHCPLACKINSKLLAMCRRWFAKMITTAPIPGPYPFAIRLCHSSHWDGKSIALPLESGLALLWLIEH